MEDHIPLVTVLMVPAALLIAFTTEHRLDADSERCQHRNYCQF